MTPPNDYVTHSECERSHDAQKRESDMLSQNLTGALGELSKQVGKLWDTMDTFRTSFRNHVPPWTASVMTVQALAIGLLAGKVFF